MAPWDPAEPRQHSEWALGPMNIRQPWRRDLTSQMEREREFKKRRWLDPSSHRINVREASGEKEEMMGPAGHEGQQPYLYGWVTLKPDVEHEKLVLGHYHEIKDDEPVIWYDGRYLWGERLPPTGDEHYGWDARYEYKREGGDAELYPQCHTGSKRYFDLKNRMWWPEHACMSDPDNLWIPKKDGPATHGRKLEVEKVEDTMNEEWKDIYNFHEDTSQKWSRHLTVRHILVDSYTEAWDIFDALCEEPTEEVFTKYVLEKSLCMTAKYHPESRIKQWRHRPGEFTFKRGEMELEFEEHVFPHEAGTLLAPFRTVDGFHIVYVHEVHLPKERVNPQIWHPWTGDLMMNWDKEIDNGNERSIHTYQQND